MADIQHLLLHKNIAVSTVSTAALPAYTYANGSSGSGATMTANANGAFPALGGASLTAQTLGGNTVNDRNTSLFLFLHGASASDNGVYMLTQQGSGGTPWIATRVTGYDTASTIPGSTVFVIGGLRAGSAWCYKNTTTITVGTTGLYWKCITRPVISDGSRIYDDFRYGIGAVATFIQYDGYFMGGTGAGAGTTETTQTGTQEVGVMRLQTGSLATNIAGVFGGSGVSPDQILSYPYFATATGFDFQLKASVHALSTGTQEFAINFGIYLERAAGQKQPTNGICFIYDRTSAVSTTNWLIVSRNGGAGTATDTGVAATTLDTFRVFRIWKEPGQGNIFASIDGVLVATYTTSDYSTAAVVTPNILLFKSVGTGNVLAADFDYFVFDTDTPGRA